MIKIPTRNKIIRFVLIACASLVVFICFCNIWITQHAKPYLYEDLSQVPEKKVALVLGTSARNRNGSTNQYFKHRMEAVVQLYKRGKISHIILSGDNGSIYYDEPTAMKKKLLELGIPSSSITLDYAGFRTLDSVVRCKKVFGQDDILIVSQAFHNSRAVFIAHHFGLEAVAFNAKDPIIKKGQNAHFREYFAKCKAVLDLYILGKEPKYLGDPVHISGI